MANNKKNDEELRRSIICPNCKKETKTAIKGMSVYCIECKEHVGRVVIKDKE